ncbi:MAG: hypothetical protein GF411_19795 [Candidatus Lokiarchaeota archaeon]|nr:hypothetical protein [Candidatus Lokiarchaeota archaeon]
MPKLISTFFDSSNLKMFLSHKIRRSSFSTNRSTKKYKILRSSIALTNSLFWMKYKQILEMLMRKNVVLFSMFFILTSIVVISPHMSFPLFRINASHSHLSNDSFIPIDFIAINGNEDFENQADLLDWSGSGTAEDPFVIENYNITNNRHLFRVVDTDYHFIFQNCWLDGLDNSWCGLYLAHVSNAIVRNVTIKNAAIGMHMLELNDSIISNCDIYDNSAMGIALELTCVGNKIMNNTIYANREGGIWLDWNNTENVIQENEIYENWIVGIELLEDSHDNIILGNTLSKNHGHGIKALGNGSKIHHNIIAKNTASGIFVYGEGYDIHHNIIWENNRMGIWGTFLAQDNSIYNNTILNCSSYAVRLDGKTSENTVRFNDFIDNAEKYQCIDDGTENIFDWNYYNPWNHTDADMDFVIDFAYLIEGSKNNTDIHPTLHPNTDLPDWYAFEINQPAGIPEPLALMIPAIGTGVIVIMMVLSYVWWRNKPKE